MRIKFAIALLLMVAVATTTGCLKKYAAIQETKASKKAYFEYGPIEFHGARAEHTLTDIPYARSEQYSEYLTADLYWNDHDAPMPIVINIHGGGWEIGDKRMSNSVFRAKYLAARGYLVISVNYRMLPAVPIQTQVEDVMGAVIWAKENAAEYGGDPEKIGVMGGSAGGHLTTMVAWASDDDFFTPTGHADSELDSDVLAAVPFYPAIDLEQTLALENEYLAPVSHAYFTKTRDEDERAELFEHIAPKYQMDADLPPTFFVCGDEDDFNIYPDVVAFEKKLGELGVETGLYTAPGGKHGFDTLHGEQYSQEAMEATAAWFDKYLK